MNDIKPLIPEETAPASLQTESHNDDILQFPDESELVKITDFLEALTAFTPKDDEPDFDISSSD